MLRPPPATNNLVFGGWLWEVAFVADIGHGDNWREKEKDSDFLAKGIASGNHLWLVMTPQMIVVTI